MARIAWSEVDALPDILSTDGYALVLGSIPGAGMATDLTIKCQNVSIPGFSTEAYEVALHGFVKRFRGRKMFPRQLTATFYEDSNFATLNKLRNWSEFVAGAESGTSQGYQADYSVDAVLYIYDTTGREINRTFIEHVYPQDVPDVQLDSTSSQGMIISVTFSYDRIRSSGHATL